MNWNSSWEKSKDKDSWGNWPATYCDWGRSDPVKDDDLTRCILVIEHGGVLHEVECIQIGDLGYHVDLDHEECFSITHVPSLSNFMAAVPHNGAELDQADLLKWMEKVQTEHKQFWAVLQELTQLTYAIKSDRVYEAKDKIKEWCLSVPIIDDKWV